MIGQVVGNYQIVDRLSEGGMGAVFRARHAMIGKSAAVKVLLPELSTNREIVQRFFNEARAATSIRHPGIVEIYDFGYHADGRAYIVMELLDGETLSRRLARRGRLAEGEAAALIRQVASALGAAHASGVVHRDLKPDNIFVVPDPDMPGGERTKILDFGIAKLADAEQVGHSKTRTGAVMGTPTYMSPEQCRGSGDVDHRSDLYSLGCILYQLVTGRPPFVAEGAGEIIGAHLHLAPSSPRPYAPELSLAMEQLVMALLAKDPAQRVQTAGELAQMLGGGTAPQIQVPVSYTPVPVSYTPAPSATPTTLGGAAAQVQPTTYTRGGGGKWIALVAILALAGGGIVVATQLGGKGESKSEPDEQHVAAPEPEAPKPEAPKPEPRPEPKPEPKPAAPVKWTFAVTPAKATIRVDGKLLDQRTFELAADASPTTATIEAPGHQPQTISLVPADGDRTITVALEATPKKSTGKRKPKPAPGSATTGSPIEDDL